MSHINSINGIPYIYWVYTPTTYDKPKPNCSCGDKATFKKYIEWDSEVDGPCTWYFCDYCATECGLLDTVEDLTS